MTKTHKLILSNLQQSIDHLVSQIRHVKVEDPFTQVLVLLPSTSAVRGLRAQLNNMLAVNFYQFYSLGDAILEEVASPINLITDSTVRRLISQILIEMEHDGLLTSFSPMIGKPGFVEVLVEWLREVKSQGIHPEAYKAFTNKHHSQRDLQLSEFYVRYQNYLNRKMFADPDGRLWLVAEALETDGTLFTHEGPFYVLGHDQFTPVQLRILKALADRFEKIIIYLPWDVDRDEDSLALARLNETKTALLNCLQLELAYLDNTSPSKTALSQLGRHLFENQLLNFNADRSLQMIEAPSREAEVRSVLRAIKKLLLAGAPPEDIGVLAPSPAVYLPIMRTVGQEYDVPLSCEVSINEEPLVVDFVTLLQLAPSFTWRSTFLALRSAYIQQNWLSQVQIDQLDRLTRDQPVLEGTEQWLAALIPIKEVFPDFEDEDHGPPPFISTLTDEEILALREGLLMFFEHFSPPEQATIYEYTWWVQTKLLGIYPNVENSDEISLAESHSLQMLACCQNSPNADHDLQVFNGILSSLRALLNAYQQISNKVEITWDDFSQELIAVIRSQKIDPESHSPKVLFAPLAEGRVRVFEHLFVLGLSEGEFPTRPSSDVFYAPEERENFPLPIRRYIPAHEASLFWQVINNVRSSLTLLRPYIDENGAPWQPSPYWDAVADCFEDLSAEQIPISGLIEIEDAASLSELLVACTQANVSAVPDQISALYDYAQNAEKIHAQRNSYRPPGIFEGILEADDLVREVNQRYSPTTVWSASRLNTYGNCPFKFFADNLLELKARPEPEDGLNPMQRGSLLHILLEKTIAILQDQGLSLDEHHLELVLAALDASCEAVFPSAHLRFGFQPTPLWGYEQEELKRLLRVYLSWECSKNQGQSLPFLQEAQFGTNNSDKEALKIDALEGHFLLRGVIDRIDRNLEGNLEVIDYKSGATGFTEEDIQKGLALQTALYALAAECFWTGDGGLVRKSEYRHLPSRKASGSLSFSTMVEEDQTVQMAVNQAYEHIQRIRKGIFPSATEKSIRGRFACTAYCDYAPLCRVSRQSISKARKAGLK